MGSISSVEQSFVEDRSAKIKQNDAEQMPWRFRLRELCSENLAAKIIRSANDCLKNNVSLSHFIATEPFMKKILPC